MATSRDVTPRTTRVIMTDPFNDDDTYIYTRPLLVGYGLTTSQAYVTRAVAALASNAIVSPFDVVQTLAQVGSKEGKKSYANIIEDIWEKEGITGFFRGALTGSLRFVETAVLNYVIYYALKKALADELGVLSENNHQIANAASIVLSSLLTYPLEVVRTRLILDFDKQKYPSGAVDCFLDTLNTEGWSGLFSGAALSAIASYTMIEVMERIWTPVRVGLAITPPKLVDAAIQSLVAQTLYYPVDTVVKMVQAPQFYKKLHPDVPFDGVVEAASSTTSKYGFFSLWRGYVVAAIKVVPFIMVTSFTYQLTADAFERSNLYKSPVGIANNNTRVERLG